MSIGSKLKAAKTVVTSKTARRVLVAQKHSPEMLFVIGTVGAISSTVIACRATLKLDEALAENRAKVETANALLEQKTERYTEKDYRSDITKLFIKKAVVIGQVYGPAAALGLSSYCALGGSHLILSKRNAGLMAAYAALDKGFGEYRDRVIDFVGADKERELRFESETRDVAKDDKDGTKVEPITSAVKKGEPSIYARFFDQTCDSWNGRAEYNNLFLRGVQNHMNDMLVSRGHVLLNDVYEALGLPRTQAGMVVGWVISKTGDNYVDFGIFDGTSQVSRDFVNGREGAILLDFNVDGIIYDKI